MDRYFCIAELLEQFINFLSFAGVFSIIVIIEKQSVGIGRMCVLKCFGNEFLTTDLIPLGFTVKFVVIVINHFVDNVPRIDCSFIARDNRSNMVFESL